MASEHVSVQSDSGIWTPGKRAVCTQSWSDPNDEHPTSVLLRHPTDPFVRVLDKDIGISESDLHQVAFEYLSQVNSGGYIDAHFPTTWLEALKPGENDPCFGWLPIQSPVDADIPADPLASFWIERSPALSGESASAAEERAEHRWGEGACQDAGAAGVDRTLILLASERFADYFFLGSGFGIRIVAHLRPIETTFEVIISGMSARFPFGVYKQQLKWSWDDVEKTNAFIQTLFSEDIKKEIATTLGLKSVCLQGLRLAQPDGGEFWVERRGTGVGKSGISFSFVFVGSCSRAGRLINKVALAAAATVGRARVFYSDPASKGAPEELRWRRPARSEAALDQFRVEQQITVGPNDPLEYGSKLRVEVSPRFVREDGRKKAAKSKKVNLPGAGPAIRSNNFSAVSAYKTIEQFFERLQAYGICANSYFRLAKLPLQVSYRSGIEPGPGKDGQTVNARVLPEGWPADAVGPTKPGTRPSITVHLALANLSHRSRKGWDRKKRSPAEPLGIAADPRWVWHEIGHVLLMASIGELEFRFAHSPGDALAAIVSDPESKLAVNAKARGRTFPWVFLPRRHDRCVSHGWSWSGSLHRALASVPSRASAHRKGYWSEQILSSSLFRLYRCLGGDTIDRDVTIDTIARQSASHYSVYLIIKAIQMLGPSRIVLAQDPDQFVSALIDADIGTSDWTITFPPKDGPTFKKIGGCAHKVIRWAFESQGLYAAPGNITNAPGLPPPVDIYIKDLRSLKNRRIVMFYMARARTFRSLSIGKVRQILHPNGKPIHPSSTCKTLISMSR